MIPTLWHKNLMVIKFYGLPLNHLDENFTDSNFTVTQFRAQYQGNI